MTREELIAALEMAEGPNRELDAKIAGMFSNSVEWDDGEPWWGPHDAMPTIVPHFTESIDDALKLAPDGIEGYGVSFEMNQKSRAWVRGRVSNDTERWEYYKTAKANTGAIAICIAALKARVGV